MLLHLDRHRKWEEREEKSRKREKKVWKEGSEGKEGEEKRGRENYRRVEYEREKENTTRREDEE